MEQRAYDTWKLVSLSPLPALALAALGAATVLGVALACWGVRREPEVKKRAVLWVLRALAGVCALFFLLEPGVRHLQVARVKNRVAVLVDRSASMSFPVSEKGPSRSEAAARTLEALAPQMDALKDRYAFELWGFDPELTAVSPQALREVPARAGRTDLLTALRAIKAQAGTGGRKLSGVLVLSDGADNAELAQGAQGRAKEALEELRVPVSTVRVGKSAPRDLAIESVKVDDFAFVRSAVTADVEVRGRGFAGELVTVVLKREGQVVGTRQVSFDDHDELKQVGFTFTPDATGRFVYTAQVTVYPDEAVAENNTRAFVLKVIRDRVRVLLVAGRPTWDERFLRGLLRQDANVELISFYILRNQADPSGVNDESRELSLIPFPTNEIFREKLHTFDVVVFLNFGYTEPGVSIQQYERDLEQYISNGGALALVGGDKSFSEARAPFTTLGDALPVTAAAPADLQPFKARLTPEGLRHPITALGTGAVSTEQAWEALPLVPGANLTRARPGAAVLLDHPFATVDGKNAPLLALWDYGRGRTLALLTDGAWVWNFGAHAQGQTSRAYERFWSNALRWLVRDPDLTLMQVSAEPPAVEPGRPVAVVVGARAPDYQPAAGAQVVADLVDVSNGKVVASEVASTSADGTARVEFPPPSPGAYKVVVRARQGDKVLGEGSDAIAVRAVGQELADARIGQELLESIASLTGGKAFSADDVSLDAVPLLEPPLVEVGRSKDQPLWDRWYWLVVLIAVVGFEWGLRRRFGYV